MDHGNDGMGLVIIIIVVGAIASWLWERRKRGAAVHGVVLVPVQPQRKRGNWLGIAVLIVLLIVVWHYVAG